MFDSFFIPTMQKSHEHVTVYHNSTVQPARLNRDTVTCMLMRFLPSWNKETINHIMWISVSDGVPYDGVPKQNIIKTHPAIVAIINILAVVGIAFSITCMVFNFVFRKKRYYIAIPL